MSLTPDGRIGPYDVLGSLGAGGMGEVYRARDTKLKREVALKILPALFASDPERIARFEREAQALAAVNHPNIAQVYGIVEGPPLALVMELVEGEDLSQRLARGAMPLDRALPIAKQLADALEAAHERGVVHRDLKPANIKVHDDGTVKVLDFGLAKLAAQDAVSSVDLQNSPTFTSPATEFGIILGTAAYMAPEQAKGKGVDKRADIWAFGVVLFEMLTGTRPFGGETASETLAAIIKDRPSWDALPSTVPASLRALMKRLLEKDPRRRLRDIGDARLVLEDLEAGSAGTPDRAETASLRAAPSWRAAVPWVLALIAGAAALLLMARPLPGKAGEPPLLKFTLPITGESLERTGLPAISPDGRHVVFVKGGQLWIRSLDELEPRQLAGTAGAQFPFWSPDSRQVAYLTAAALWRVGIDGSLPVQIATYRFSKGGRTPGGVWRTDDMIVFAPSATGSGFFAVSAQGGEFSNFYTRDPKVEGDFHRPSLLPDGRSLLFVVDHPERGADAIGLLVDGKRRDVLSIKGEVLDSAVYSPTGHILYHRETTSPGIWALPFSLERLEETGAPFLVVPQGSYPSMSASGTLIYADNSVSGVARLAWVDIATGAVVPALDEQFPGMGFPRLSPSGRHVTAVVQSPGEGQVIIVADLQRGTHVRIADRADNSSRPGWLDDETIVFARNDGLSEEIVMRRANGSGSVTVLTRGMQPSVRSGHLVLSKISPGSGGDLYDLLLPRAGTAPGQPTLLQQLPTHEWEPTISPDGTLLAYTAGDAGQSEIILRTYPGATGQWQVSAGGGSLPVWSRMGDALYYKDTPGQIYRVDVTSKPSVALGTPVHIRRPSNLLARVGFDIAPDGKRLLMVEEVRTDERRTAALAVVQNWAAAFRK